MCYFNTLLEKRDLDTCPLPLWKLKITDEEFEELRILLEKRTHIINLENPFMAMSRECTLFFAEYWRRIYVDGPHSRSMVYDALKSTRSSVNLGNEFYAAAQEGAIKLNIEKYNGDKIDPLNDLLYQGGLPMKLVTGDHTGVWDRFARGLVNSRINFDDLNLGLVAAQSQSMREFCRFIIEGVDREDPSYMPFYCENKSDLWYQYLIDLAKDEVVKRRALHPFSLDWEFVIDRIEKTINLNFLLKGTQKLPQPFLESNGLSGCNFFSVQVRQNGIAIDTFDYSKNFCRYAVLSSRSYNDGDTISLYLHDQENPHLSKSIDMSIPHLLYRNIRDGHYYIGNRMGETECLLLLPEGWHIDNEENTCEYLWKDTRITCVELPVDYAGNIFVRGNDGETMTFGKDIPLYNTRIRTSPLNLPVKETLYNVDNCRFSLCYDTPEGERMIDRPRIVYRNLREREWSDTHSYGDIFVKAVAENGSSVSPIRLINVGEGLTINTIEADDNRCMIRVSWPHGSVSSQDAVLHGKDEWEAYKERCADPKMIRFTFTPRDGGNPFTLNIKSRFRDFSILNIDGERIESGYVPYSDIDRYQYHLVGKSISYQYVDISHETQRVDGRLHLTNNGQNRTSIPSDGSLLTLLGSHEELRSMLDRTSDNMLYAEVPIVFNVGDGQKITLIIKDAPFKPIQLEDNRIDIITSDGQPIDYKRPLKLLKLDAPTQDAVVMKYDAENGYVLPEAIMDWGKTLLIGNTRGRIRPVLVEYGRILDAEARRTERKAAIDKVNDELEDSHLSDAVWKRIADWFDRSQNEDIPANSLLDLHCTAQKAERLLCLAFILFGRCSNEDEMNILKEQLNSFSKDLAFQWYWLLPCLNRMREIIMTFIDDPETISFKEIYIKWSLQQGAEMNECLSALALPDIYYIKIVKLISDFESWIKTLCESSLVDSYDNVVYEIITAICNNIVNKKNLIEQEIDSEMYVDHNQNNLDEYTKNFFANYNEANLSGNEQWLIQRVNAVVAHLRGGVDLFTADENERNLEKIRRSIVFAAKSCNYQFVMRLNNKLIRH